MGKRGFTYIGVTCRGDLLDYLVGRIDTCPGLERDVIEGRKRPKGGDVAELQPVKRPKDAQVGVAELSLADVLTRVRAVKDLDALVRCPGRVVPNVDLILRIAEEERKHYWQDRVPNAEDAANMGKTPLYMELEDYLRKDKNALPIILVPCNKKAPVNLLNVSDFLQHGNYKKPDEERLRFFESTRPESVQVARNLGGKLWTFEIRDSAAKFTKAEWKRTVCVVCDGSDWQFKGWPFESTVDLFTTVRGIFFQAVGVPVPVHVNSWQVEVLRMSALHLEHRFAHVRDQFFRQLEEHLNSFRNRKFANHTAMDPEKRIIEKPKPVL